MVSKQQELRFETGTRSIRFGTGLVMNWNWTGIEAELEQNAAAGL